MTDRDDNLTAVVNIRVTAEERGAVAEQAEIAGLTVSAYCRRLIRGRVVSAKADTTVIRELRKLGGLLKLVHVESCGVYSAATAAALADLRSAINRIAR